MKSIKIALSVGEKSGDYLGAELIKNIKKNFPNASFVGLGGEEMKKEGVKSLFPIENLSVMGLIDPLLNIKNLLSKRKQLIDFILQEDPDIFIGIDSPSFNSGISKYLKTKTNIKTIQYVCPQFWAWRKNRVKKFNTYIDHIFTLFPFESDLLNHEGVSASFTGHPLAEIFALNPNKEKAKENMGLNTDVKYIALLPGSRKSEIKHHMNLFLEVADNFKEKNPDFKFILALTDETKFDKNILSKHTNVILKKGESRNVMVSSDYALVASGTASLEALLSKTPHCVVYKSNPFSNFILSRLLTTKFISLPNILAEKEIISEFRQKNASLKNICNELNKISNSSNKEMNNSFYEIHESLKNINEDKFIGPLKALLS